MSTESPPFDCFILATHDAGKANIDCAKLKRELLKYYRTRNLDKTEKILLSENHHSRMFYELLRLIGIRKRQRAFHPNATQFTLGLGNSVLALWRQSLDRTQSIFSIHNISNQKIAIQLSDLNLIETDNWFDLISGTKLERSHGKLMLTPYQSMWITNKSSIM